MTRPRLSEKQQIRLRVLDGTQSLFHSSTAMIADRSHVSRQQALGVLRSAYKRGYVEQERTKSATVWRLTPAGQAERLRLGLLALGRRA